MLPGPYLGERPGLRGLSDADGTRIARDRQAEIGLMQDRAQGSRPPNVTPRRLVQVYNAGAMPTAPNYFYACHPCEIDDPEVEGGSATPNCDESTTIYVDLIRGTATAGDFLNARSIGNRWVAERGGSANCNCYSCERVAFPYPGPLQGVVTLALTPNPTCILYDLFASCGANTPPYTPSGYGPYQLDPQQNCQWGYLCAGNSACGFIGSGACGDPFGFLLGYDGTNIHVSMVMNAPIQGSTPSWSTDSTNPATILDIISYQTNPFYVHLKPREVKEGDVPIISGGLIIGVTVGTPFTDMYLSAQMPSTGISPPIICATFCCSGQSGCTAEVYQSQGGTLLASGATGPDDCVTLYWTGKNGDYYVVLTCESSTLYSGALAVACDGIYSLCPEEDRDRLVAGSISIAAKTTAGPSASPPPQPPPAHTEYPPLTTQLGNAAGALARAVKAVVTGERVVVSAAEQARRLEICRACEQFDAAQQRCRLCGCKSGWKNRLATEHCPLPEPKW